MNIVCLTPRQAGYFQVKCYKIQTIQNNWFLNPLHWWPVLKSMPPKLQPSWKILQTLSVLNTLEAEVGPSPQYLNSFVGWKLKSFLKVDHYFLVNAFSRIVSSFYRNRVKTQLRKKSKVSSEWMSTQCDLVLQTFLTR